MTTMAVRFAFRLCVGAAILAPLGVAAPCLGQGGALAALRGRYPGVKVYEAGGRVRTVYGTAMTAGATPREAAATRELFLDWMLIAQVPGTACCGSPCTNTLQSADPGTLVEILSVAPADYVPTICEVFFDRAILHPDPPPNACEESAGWSCYGDCDSNGVLDIFDFLCFQSAFAAGDPYADCDSNGVLDIFDFVCFQNAFAAGCP